MTERRRDMLAATPDRLRIGLSALEWRDGALTITVDERTAPIPSRLQGRIVLRPHALFDTVFELDVAGRHRWTPLAPCAAVEVDLTSPGWRWSGHGYLDTNEGDRALEQDFATWQWSRATMPDGSTVVLYDATRRDSTRLGLARRFLPAGSAQSIRMPAVHDLAAGRWGMSRSTHGDAAPRLLRSLEDAPFYTRSLVETELLGKRVTAIHESLSLTRFSRRWVQALLPFRMPRRFI